MAFIKRKYPDTRAWLPPFSFATLLGMALFMVYIGSAFLSALPLGLRPGAGYSGVGALYTEADEARYCGSNLPPYDSCFSPPQPTNRTIYMQPYGGLGNRLRAIASALTIGQEINANVVIVWMEKEHGFRGAWGELFESPRIPLGCFPGKAIREDHASCKIHRVNHHSEWDAVKNKFEKFGDQEVLCMQSMMFLTKKQRGIEWFYKLIRPTTKIAQQIKDFQTSVHWDWWGQWVGVHIRRTDLKLKCNTDKCDDGVAATDVLPLTRYTDILKDIVSMKSASTGGLRFFLATDDAATEDDVRQTLADTLFSKPGEKPLNINETIVSLSKSVRDSTLNSLEMRNNATGVEEAVADLWLLSKCHLLVGTVGSSYSQSAKLMGDANFFMTVGVEYENRL